MTARLYSSLVGRSVVACALAAWACGQTWAAEPTAEIAPASGAEMADDLFEGLGELKLPPKAAVAPAVESPSTPPAAGATPSAEELRGLLEQEGEDLGSEGESPLARIGSMMRSVEVRFVEKDSSQTTQQIQEDVLTQLQAMLEQQQKKCSACNSASQSSSASKPKSSSKPGESKQGKPTPGEQASKPTDPSQKPADASQPQDGTGKPTDPQAAASANPADSVDRLEQGRLEEILRRSAADFDELWGQLPPQVQDRLKQGLTERTLPQYEPMIEAYYRRLAEDSADANR